MLLNRYTPWLDDIVQSFILGGNNTPHASLRCAPWGVTSFEGSA